MSRDQHRQGQRNAADAQHMQGRQQGTDLATAHRQLDHERQRRVYPMPRPPSGARRGAVPPGRRASRASPPQTAAAVNPIIAAAWT